MSDVGRDLCHEALATAQHILRRALSFLLAVGHPPISGGRPLIVFNPQPRPLRAPVRVSARGAVRAGERCLPAQVYGNESYVVCDLPALGWRVFELCPVAPDEDTDSVEGSYGQGQLVVTSRDGHLTVRCGDRELVRDGIALLPGRASTAAAAPIVAGLGADLPVALPGPGAFVLDAVLRVPADAPPDLGVLAYARDRHERWHQQARRGVLPPGEHRLQFVFDLDAPALNLVLNEVAHAPGGSLSHLGVQVADTAAVSGPRSTLASRYWGTCPRPWT